MPKSASRRLEAVIARAPKTGVKPAVELDVQALLEEMSTDELHAFWGSFSARCAFRAASMGTDHWKTSEQEEIFRAEASRTMFYPKDKAPNGKSLTVRADLQRHVRQHVLQHIEAQHRREKAFREGPLLKRLPLYLMQAIAVLAVVFVVGCIFPKSGLVKLACVSFLVLWCGFSLLVLDGGLFQEIRGMKTPKKPSNK